MSEHRSRSRPSSTVDRLACREAGQTAVGQLGGWRESVNHHLRTPLTVVLGHAELLTDPERELPPEVRESLECLLRAAQRLDDVVGGVCHLMDVMSAGTRVAGPVDIAALVAEEVASFQDRASRRGLHLAASAEPPQPCLADSRRLRQALRELLDNAVTHAPDGSTVRVTSCSSPTCVRMTVSDHGDGIDPHERERLTRPFERGAHPRQAPSGRGMGLSVAAAVAASHGGRLVLSGEPGRGFEACIELPRISPV